MRILIYGGSFDPIHLGHMNIAKYIKKTLHIDKVFFELAKNPRWKNPNVASNHRLKMLQLAINGLKGFEIDLYEFNSNEKINYTYDTIKHFNTRFKGAQLYFLIGYDQLDKLHEWYKIDELSKMVNFVAYNRKGSLLNQDNVNKYRVQVIEGTLFNVSSSDIRNLKSIYLDKNVLRYILDNKLYYAHNVQSMMSEKRYYHSIEVALLSLEIAKQNRLNKLKAFTAGLLHDIGKDLNKKEVEVIMQNHYKEYMDLLPFCYHQFVGAYLAQEKFGIKDNKVLEAIKFHATGIDKMSSIGKVVYASDKIEPTRGFDSSDLIAACIKNYREGFVKVLAANKEYLMKHNADINNRLTTACFLKYLK